VVLVLVLGSAAVAKDDPTAAAIKKVVTTQLAEMESGSTVWYTPDGLIGSISGFTPGGGELLKLGEDFQHAVIGPTYGGGAKPADVRVGLSRDGRSAWVTFTAKIDAGIGDSGETVQFRASELLVEKGGSWLVHAAQWSAGVADAAINKAAKAGKVDELEELAKADSGDKDLRGAFQNLVTKGFDTTAAANKQLIGIGSAPKEMTVGGASLAPGWNRAWAGKLTVNNVVATLAPSGTTGAVWANVQLAKTGYKIPFRLFVVFDKLADGSWSVLHVHFAVPSV
jgi:hypothetical protein